MDETHRARDRARLRPRARPPARTSRPRELRVGLGRDMRLTAPAMAAEVRDGLIFEGATVLDAGMVATEMLYHLVGSRELDGGAMVTASHNPKAYTGVKLVREGALALSGDAGIGDVRREIEAGLGARPGRRLVRGGRHLGRVPRPGRSPSSTSSKVKPMKVVVDGGNGMAGPMVGPILEQLGLDLEEMYFEPDGEFPDHEPNPLLEENRRHDRRAGAGERRRPRDRLGRRRRPLLLHRRRRRASATATSSARCSPARRSPRHPGATDPLRPALEPRRPRPGRRRGRPLRPLPRRPRLLQGADARGGRRLRRRGLRPLLLPRLLVRRLGDDPGPADARAALGRRPHASPS